MTTDNAAAPPSANTASSDLFADKLSLVLRVLSGISILMLAVWMLVGIVGFGVDLFASRGVNWSLSAEQVIVKALIVLALLEVIRTFQAYLKLGRVRVTFIIDTALVVLIGELMGLWFKEYAPEKVLLSMGVITMLVVLRIVTTKFSPEPHH